MSGPLVLAVESSCDETGIALVEGGRRIHANVVASPGRAARRVRRDRPGGRRAGPPALDRARSSTRRWADAGVDWADVDAIAVTYGPGLAGSLLVGINFAKALAWVHDMPLVGVNHLEGHVYAAWLLDPGEAERAEPVFPLVALVVSGGHTFLAEMRDHLTYRLLGHDRRRRRRRGVRQGRAAARPRLPGRAGDPAGGRGRDARATGVFPRAWLGDSYDFSFSGLKTAARRIVDEARADEGLRRRPRRAAARRRSSPSSPGASRMRSSTCSRPRRSGRPGGRCALDRARRRRGRERAPCARGWPARPRRWASR